MIRDSGGRYWLQTLDNYGRVRSSFLGQLGSADVIQAWCNDHEIDFRQVEPSTGHKRQFAARTAIW